jgi:alcohol dehydrogenase, propanol-preferring
MKAMMLERIAPVERDGAPLKLVELATPVPGPREILIRVNACGVCHTELDEIEGRLVPPRLPVIPGHQVIGVVCEAGEQAKRFPVGARVGVGWIHNSDGSEFENLSAEFSGTGCDANGGYAEYMTIKEDYAVPVPDEFDDLVAAPLLCAGAIGYRALKLAGLRNGEALGLTGFGGSAHIVMQLFRYLNPDSPVYVFSRSRETQEFALQLGADWSGATEERAPNTCQAIIDTTPAWLPVVAALENLAPGGRLLINAIRKEGQDQGALLDLSYHEHLWMEREIKSVANITYRDIAEFLPLAAEAGIRPEVQSYALEEANDALIALKFEPTQGAKVLKITGD